MNPNYYLVTSSSMLALPAIYGIYKGHLLLPFMSTLSTTASILYWMNPESRSKRTVDVILARTCGIVYFLHGVYYIEPMHIRTIGYLNTTAILTTYYCSHYHKNNPNIWILFHMMFYYFTMLGKFIVFY